MPDAPRFRIGELARRTGCPQRSCARGRRATSCSTPSRSGAASAFTPRRTRHAFGACALSREKGLSASEAARSALEGGWSRVEAPATTLDEAATELRLALESYDEVEAQALLDRFLTTLTLDSVLGEVVLPCLREIGDRWELGEVSIAQEHFAANLIRGRLLALARGWGQGRGPRALLACAPGELHDLGLISFGLALRARGWTITFLGSSTPVETLAAAGTGLEPELVLVTATIPERLEENADALRVLAGGASRCTGRSRRDRDVRGARGCTFPR